MEKLVFFLSQHGLHASLHIVYENQRIESSSSIFKKPKYGVMLETGDPPHWMTSRSGSTSLESYPIPDEVTVIYPFTFIVSEIGERHDNQTDRGGWRYNDSFQGRHWCPLPSRSSCVRQRKWERLVVLTHQYHQAMCVLPEYYKQLTEFRCLHPLIMKASLGLKKYSYKMQLVMENQRKQNGVFSSQNLQDGTDPPEWSMGPQGLFDDPTHCDARNIQAFEQAGSIFDRTKGYDILHDFIYILYPDKDTFGWEYNTDFFKNSESTWQRNIPLKGVNRQEEKDREGKEDSCVRRRIWFRTIVADCDLAGCRSTLLQYLSERPSGVSSDGTLLLLNLFGNKWRVVTATLSGSRLLVHDPLKEMKKLHEFDLCDYVMSELNAKDCPGKTQGFGLRKKCLSNIHSFKVIFSTQSQEDHQFWTEKIEFQMCQIDLSRMLPSGPPRCDPVLLVSDMWMHRKSKIPHNWALKTFELHQSGYLKVYHGTNLKCQYDVINCKYSVKCPKNTERYMSSEGSEPFCGDGTRFEFDLLLRDREIVSIRAMSRSVMNMWLEKLVELFQGGENFDLIVDGVSGVSGYSSNQVLPEIDRSSSSSSASSLMMGYQSVK